MGLTWLALTHLRGPGRPSALPASGLCLRPCHSTERTSWRTVAASASDARTDEGVEPRVRLAPHWSPRPAGWSATAAPPLARRTLRSPEQQEKQRPESWRKEWRRLECWKMERESWREVCLRPWKEVGQNKQRFKWHQFKGLLHWSCRQSRQLRFTAATLHCKGRPKTQQTNMSNSHPKLTVHYFRQSFKEVTVQQDRSVLAVLWITQEAVWEVRTDEEQVVVGLTYQGQAWALRYVFSHSLVKIWLELTEHIRWTVEKKIALQERFETFLWIFLYLSESCHSRIRFNGHESKLWRKELQTLTATSNHTISANCSLCHFDVCW